eukprot:4914033-Alexandrium_andersonii.AAC.1
MEIRLNLQHGRLPPAFEASASGAGRSGGRPASNIIWAKHNLNVEPRFGPHDLPAFGMFLRSAPLIHKAGCDPSDLQLNIGELHTRVAMIQSAIDSILVAEN